MNIQDVKLAGYRKVRPAPELTLALNNPFDCSMCESGDCTGCGESAYGQGKVDQLAHNKKELE